MKHHSNTLTFLIMTQALKNVKTSFGFKPVEQKKNEERDVYVEDELADSEVNAEFDADVPEIDEKILAINWDGLDEAAQSSWFNHPKTECVFFEDYTKASSSDYPSKVIISFEAFSEDLLTSVARMKDQVGQVWLAPQSPDFWKGLSEKEICLSSQLGFGFAIMENHREHFEASKHFWRYFFVSRQSRQWIYPWCDIISAHLSNYLKAGSGKKLWAGQTKSKASDRLEDDVVKLFETVLGGQGMTNVLLAATNQHLTKKGFFEGSGGNIWLISQNK